MKQPSLRNKEEPHLLKAIEVNDIVNKSELIRRSVVGHQMITENKHSCVVALEFYPCGLALHSFVDIAYRQVK